MYGGPDVDVISLVDGINAGSFPLVRSGYLSEDEYKNVLLQDIVSCAEQGTGSPADGCLATISLDVWMEYVREVSSCCGEFDYLYERILEGFGVKLSNGEAWKKIEHFVDLFVRKVEESKRTLGDIFHYYDNTEQGALSLDSFKKMCVSIGLNVSDEEKTQAFMFLGTTNSNTSSPGTTSTSNTNINTNINSTRVEYKTFAKYVKYLSENDAIKLGRPQGYDQIKQRGPLEHDPDAEPTALCAKIRKHLISYHPRGLSIIFNTMHSLNRTGSSVTRKDFLWGMSVCGLRLGTAESAYLCKYFSKGGELVNKEEFLDYMRGDMEVYSVRKQGVEARITQVAPGPGEYNDSDYCTKKWEPAFGGSEFVAAQFILDKYDPYRHPAYLKGKTDLPVLKEEFFNYLGESLSIGRASKGKIIKYLCDECVTMNSQNFWEFLYTCIPSRNPEVEDKRPGA